VRLDISSAFLMLLLIYYFWWILLGWQAKSLVWPEGDLTPEEKSPIAKKFSSMQIPEDPSIVLWSSILADRVDGFQEQSHWGDRHRQGEA
jgi:hypothetical protein